MEGWRERGERLIERRREEQNRSEGWMGRGARSQRRRKLTTGQERWREAVTTLIFLAS